MHKNLVKFVVAVLFLSSCGSPTVREQERLTSPDGLVDAVHLYRGGGGAAGYAFHELYLIPAAAPVGERVYLRVSGSPIRKLEWVATNKLEVSYATGSFIDTFYNMYFLPAEEEYTNSKRYEIILKRIPWEHPKPIK